jgi:hypothetical protein
MLLKLPLILAGLIAVTNFCQANAKQVDSIAPGPNSSSTIEGHFSSKVWKDELTKYAPVVCRDDELRKLLQDYNLIGMSRKQINELLGFEDVNGAYTIAGPIDTWTGLYFEYANQKVKQWRFTSALGKHGEWISSNVLWIPGSGTFLTKTNLRNKDNRRSS